MVSYYFMAYGECTLEGGFASTEIASKSFSSTAKVDKFTEGFLLAFEVGLEERSTLTWTLVVLILLVTKDCASWGWQKQGLPTWWMISGRVPEGLC